MKFHRKHGTQSGGIGLSSVYLSILGTLLCMVCLAGSSWAWFEANRTVSLPSMSSAEIGITSLTVDGTTPPASTTAYTRGSITFQVGEAHTPYAVKTSFGGTASSGYLTVTTCDGTFYSTQKGTELQFTLLLSEPSAVTLSVSWGSPANPELWEPLPSDGSTVVGNVLPCICAEKCLITEKIVTVTPPPTETDNADTAADDTHTPAENTDPAAPETESSAAETETAAAKTTAAAVETKTLTVSTVNEDCPLCHFDYSLCKSTVIPTSESEPASAESTQE